LSNIQCKNDTLYVYFNKQTELWMVAWSAVEIYVGSKSKDAAVCYAIDMRTDIQAYRPGLVKEVVVYSE
jgi:hypothetical protein